MHVFVVANASLIVLSLKNVFMIETLSQVWHALNVVLTLLPVRQLYKHLVSNTISELLCVPSSKTT